MIEPVSTLLLIAGFSVAPLTRLPDWQAIPQLQCPMGAGAPDRTITTTLVSPDNLYVPSEELTAAFINQMLSLDKLSSLALELELYEGLQDGWDGPDSRAPSQVDIQVAKTLLEKLPPGLAIPKPMLSSAGSVGLYWDTNSFFADIALEDNGRISLFTRSKRDDRKESFVDAVELEKLTPQWFKENLTVLLDA